MQKNNNYRRQSPPQHRGQRRPPQQGYRRPPQQGRRMPPPQQQRGRQPVKKKSSMGDKLFNIALIAALIFFLYVMFVMPTNENKGPVDSNTPGTSTNQTVDDFNFYMYLNKADSSRGKLEKDLTFKFKDGNELVVESEVNFNTLCKNSTKVGSTKYSCNGNAAVIDDYTYIKDGYRYVRTSTGYVKSPNEHFLEPGSLNIGQIWDSLTKSEELIKEDGLSCYKYSGVMTYNKMSTTLRNFVRSQNVNIANIETVQLNIELFITESNLPYKMIISFEDVGCMVKSQNLSERNGTVSGSITITMGGFNGGDALDIPDLESATEGTYTFADKVTRFLNGIGVTKE